MEEGKIVLTVEQRDAVFDALQKSFKEAGKVIEILENATVIQESVESMIDDDDVPDPVPFYWYENRTDETLSYVTYDDADKVTVIDFDERGKLRFSTLPKGKVIIEPKAFYHGKKLTILNRLCRLCPETEATKDKWKKAKGYLVLNPKIKIELHWYEHPAAGEFKLPKTETEEKKPTRIAGAIMIKIPD